MLNEWCRQQLHLLVHFFHPTDLPQMFFWNSKIKKHAWLTVILGIIKNKKDQNACRTVFLHRLNLSWDELFSNCIFYIFHPANEHFIAKKLQKNSTSWNPSLSPIHGSCNRHGMIEHSCSYCSLIRLTASISIWQIF